MKAPGPERLRAGLRNPLVIFPLLVMLAMATLVLFDLNGSSVGLLGVGYKHDASLLHGTLRGIRSDEFSLSTPYFVGNTRRGLPTTPWVGLTATFLPATSIGVPSVHWSEFFKPQDWGVFILGVSRAFAWHWWSQIALAMLGTFALLFTVTRRRWTSAALAMVAALSPYVAWWSLTPGLALGFSTGAAAAMLAALRARTTGRAVAMAVLAGYLGVATFLVLYPPWQVTLAWVLLGLIAGAAIDARVPLRRLLVVIATVGAASVVPVAVWFQQSQTALTATANTFYPGQRLAGAGQGNVAWLFDQMSSPFASVASVLALRGPSVMADGKVILANQSEIASAWLPLPVLVVALVAIVVVIVRRPSGDAAPGTDTSTDTSTDTAADTGSDTYSNVDTSRDASTAAAVAAFSDAPVPNAAVSDTGHGPQLLWTGVGVAAAGALLVAWSLLPLPAWFGQVTLLDRVPGQRTSLALGLVTVLLLAIASSLLREAALPAGWLLAWSTGAAATIWLMVWAADVLPWGVGGAPHTKKLVPLTICFVVAFTLVASGRRTRIGLVFLAGGSLVTWAMVNPLYHGLGPLTNDPVVRAMAPLAAGPTPARVAVYGNLTLVALVQASGVVTLSGLTVYPDANVWRALAPDQKAAWNNYSKYSWVADAGVNPARIVSSGTHRYGVVDDRLVTNRVLLINPCAPQTLALQIDWVVADSDLSTFSCLRPAGTIKRGGTLVYRYRVAAS